MRELVFTDKNCKDTFGLSDSSYSFVLKKPMLCPHCGAYQDGTIVSRAIHSYIDGLSLGDVCYSCTHCKRNYLVTYTINKKERIANFEAYFPPESASFENEILQGVSPRFVDAYNQALRCEIRGDIELASIGFRQALECLVKDFAITELGAERSEVIKKSLCNAISDYLGEKDLVATADVVRILGNDYAHYERKYPEHDFELLKRYMEIFTKLVETKMLIAHPPVSRI